MPARKKDPSTRARRNKASTAATLHEKPAPEPDQDYARMTVTALRAEIDRRNASRIDDEKLPRRGAKAMLVSALTEDDDDTPKLPRRIEGWHPLTEAWWADVWASPMSSEWHESDVHNVYICAMLYDDMWTGETAIARGKAAAEFRQQRAVLGLTPYDRRRLEWTIESAQEATDRGKQRRSAGQPPAPAKPGAKKKADPRAGLHAVS